MHKVPEGHDPLNRSPYCGDPAALVSYLYNDGTPEELAEIAAHVQACEPCTRDLAALGDTREQIAAWSPPDTELNFTLAASDAVPVAYSPALSANSAAAASVPWWRQATPLWMQAVAATMVFGAGLAMGTSGRAVAPSPAGAAAPATAPLAVTRSELASLEKSLRAEFAQLSRPAPSPAPVVAHVDNAGRDEALMERVRSLLNDSEERQRRELAMRTTQVMRDLEIQRKVDLAQVQQNIGQIQGVTDAELRQQRQLYNMLMNNASLPGPGGGR